MTNQNRIDDAIMVADLMGQDDETPLIVCQVLRTLSEEVLGFRKWIDDLQSGMYINCVYCGHKYGPKDEVSSTMADALKEHIEQCPKHPMSALKKEHDELYAALVIAGDYLQTAPCSVDCSLVRNTGHCDCRRCDTYEGVDDLIGRIQADKVEKAKCD